VHLRVFDDPALVMDDKQVIVVMGVLWVTERLKFPTEDGLCLLPA
jgi:hypothetical protein